jgi:hypothetical protein
MQSDDEFAVELILHHLPDITGRTLRAGFRFDRSGPGEDEPLR